MYVITKPAAFEGDIYVSAVLQKGARIDNVIVRDPALLPVVLWKIKKYKTEAAALRDLEKMQIGGFDGYSVTSLDI